MNQRVGMTVFARSAKDGRRINTPRNTRFQRRDFSTGQDTEMGKPRTDRQKLIEKCDALWSRSVRERDEHHCRRCGKSPWEYVAVLAHHIFGRSNMATRFDLDNGVTLCLDCHRYAHSHPEEFQAWVWLGMGFMFDGLRVKAQVVVHYKNFELLEILEQLKRAG